MRVTVRRYDPSNGRPPYDAVYEIDVADGRTRTVDHVLDKLRALDPGLGLRCSCRIGVCGGDGLVMNGRVGLACQTALADVVENDELVLEPVPDVPLERDLVVDIPAFRDRYAHLLVERPRFARSRTSIEIDITYACDLQCSHCNRSCTQAPSREHMGLGQIRRFVSESVRAATPWSRIRVLGGEPTLHPDLDAILATLLRYKHEHAPGCRVMLVTNGHSEATRERLTRLPPEVEIENTQKVTRDQPFHDLFNVAPVDVLQPGEADFTMGCPVASVCGMGLTPYGYYPCAVAGAIDRVMGLDLGRKALPRADDDMRDLLDSFCRFCGHFLFGERKDEEISPTWQRAYSSYAAAPPRLSRYPESDAQPDEGHDSRPHARDATAVARQSVSPLAWGMNAKACSPAHGPDETVRTEARSDRLDRRMSTKRVGEPSEVVGHATCLLSLDGWPGVTAKTTSTDNGEAVILLDVPAGEHVLTFEIAASKPANSYWLRFEGLDVSYRRLPDRSSPSDAPEPRALLRRIEARAASEDERALAVRARCARRLCEILAEHGADGAQESHGPRSEGEAPGTDGSR